MTAKLIDDSREQRDRYAIGKRGQESIYTDNFVVKNNKQSGKP
jgi:hypothetical protein